MFITGKGFALWEVVVQDPVQSTEVKSVHIISKLMKAKLLVKIARKIKWSLRQASIIYTFKVCH